METSHLIIILSTIVFCFIFQTIILKTRISESLTSVEETLQKTHHQVETLSEERLEKVSGIIEQSVKTLADVSSLISHLKEVHSAQNIHEEKLLNVPLKLDQFETEGHHRKSIIEAISDISQKVDQLVAKIEADAEKAHGEEIDNPIYITVSYMQTLWFVFGILFVSAIVCLLRLPKNDKDAEDFAVFFVLATGGFAVVLVILSLWHWFRPGFWLVVCMGVCFALVQLGKYVKTKRK